MTDRENTSSTRERTSRTLFTIVNPYYGLVLVLGALLLACGTPFDAAGQAPLFLVDENTTVGEITFTFEDTHTFEEEQLKKQIALQEPNFWDQVERVLPLLAAESYPFEPVILQKDVIRLRRFYQTHGFPDVHVDYYRGTSLDTTSNTIRVAFDIREGPPLILQDVGFYGPDSTRYAALLFEGPLHDEWIAFRNETSFERGERYTQVKRLRIEDTVLEWLQNHGFAFARVGAEALIDSTNNTAALRFILHPGPRTRIAEIEVSGTESVSPEIVRRELPFEVGDRFSRNALQRGQRELFALNLFRMALVNLPSQPIDSTATVSVRVDEAELHYLSAETGYARNVGLTGEGRWTHRNFFGGARQFTVSLTAETGLLAAPARPRLDQRLFRAAVSLQQPYLFVTNLTGTVSPFIEFQKNPLFEASDEFLQINAFEYGLITTLVYEFLPFRTLTLQHTISRASNLTTERTEVDEDSLATITFERDIYNKNILTLSGVFGRTDDRLAPSRGFLIRPLFEVGGPVQLSGVQYVKLGAEVAGYLPFNEDVSLTGRLNVGRIWPLGPSRYRQFTSDFENRFDLIRFYAGGANDVRGWIQQFVGPKFNRTDFARSDSTGEILFSGGLPRTRNERYEAVGGLATLSGNIELRLPFPGLSDDWRTAVFLDFGQVSTRSDRTPPCFPAFTCTQADLFEDAGELSLAPSAFHYGVGAGIRYRTPVGFIRLDLAYKLNPGPLDLQTPRNAFLVANKEYLVERYPDRNLADKIQPERHWFQRFNIHLSIGQAF